MDGFSEWLGKGMLLFGFAAFFWWKVLNKVSPKAGGVVREGAQAKLLGFVKRLF